VREFSLLVPEDLAAAARLTGQDPAGRRLKAGGVDLLDRLKEGIDAPGEVVDIGLLPAPREIAWDEHGLSVGALATLAEVAEHPLVLEGWPLLARAGGEAATPQVRNRATVGGNLCQRTRCWYFRNLEFECLRRGGSHCSAEAGESRYHAILGGGPCHHVQPSALGTALAALSGEVVALSGESTRRIAVDELFVSPADDPSRDTVLEPGEIIEAVKVPRRMKLWSQSYLKVREKETQDWPVAEVAVALRIAGGQVREARIVLGHAAPVPWRARSAETLLIGTGPDAGAIRRVADAAVEGARPLERNGYKVDLFRTTVRRAVEEAAAGGERS
jgi:xanthine dehydrogenase YagS FAD-binding subunit